MSDKQERPTADGGGGGGDDEEEEGEGPTKKGGPEGEKCDGCKKKGKKKMSFFRVGNKGKKKVRKEEKGIYVNSGCWGRCLKQPRKAVDSSGESPTSDPNSSEFTFDMLRSLIEKNEFYTRECNPHLGLGDDDY